MAKIAVNANRTRRRRNDAPAGALHARIVASGAGWSVQDVVCSRGPDDRRFEEQHDRFVIAIVTSGTFQYRSSGASGETMMAPGSLLLGSPGQCFECGHEHGVGDRCLAFHFTSDYFGEVASGRDSRQALHDFRAARLPAVRTLSPVVADACAALSGSAEIGWDELGIRLVARALQLDDEVRAAAAPASPADVARISDSVRLIDEDPKPDLTVVRLAQAAGVSPFHYLRMFESVTGTTPHQYMLRTRLRRTAIGLTEGDRKIIDIASENGFGDISNFNRAFRAEFGDSPSRYRRRRPG